MPRWGGAQCNCILPALFCIDTTCNQMQKYSRFLSKNFLSISSGISNLQSSSKWSTQWRAKIGMTFRNPALRNEQVLFSSCMRNHPRIRNHKGKITSLINSPYKIQKNEAKSCKTGSTSQNIFSQSTSWDPEIKGEKSQEPREETESVTDQRSWPSPINRNWPEARREIQARL